MSATMLHDNTPCDYCGKPAGEHSVPLNRLENFPGFSGSTAEASFMGVKFIGVLCPDKVPDG